MSSPEPVPTPPDGTTTPTTSTNEPANRQVRAWIERTEIALSAWIKRHKTALVTCFAVGFLGGVLLLGNTWDWYLRQDITPGHGT